MTDKMQQLDVGDVVLAFSESDRSGYIHAIYRGVVCDSDWAGLAVRWDHMRYGEREYSFDLHRCRPENEMEQMRKHREELNAAALERRRIYNLPENKNRRVAAFFQSEKNIQLREDGYPSGTTDEQIDRMMDDFSD